MTADLATSLTIALPELILAVGAMVILMIGVYAGRAAAGFINVLAVLLLAAAAIWLLTTDVAGEAFGGAMILDPFARVMMVLTLIGSAVALVMAVRFASHAGTSGGFYEKDRDTAILHFLFQEGEPRRWYVHFDLYSPVYSPRSIFRHLRHEYLGNTKPDWRMIARQLET